MKINIWLIHLLLLCLFLDKNVVYLPFLINLGNIPTYPCMNCVTQFLHNKRSTTQKTLLQLGKQDSIWGSKAVIWDCRGNHKSIDTIPQDAAHTQGRTPEKIGREEPTIACDPTQAEELYYCCGITSTDQWLTVGSTQYYTWRFFCCFIVFSSLICRNHDTMSIVFFHKRAWSSASIICHQIRVT